jgi:hypothetical protein
MQHYVKLGELMPQALITLSNNANRVLSTIKAKYELKDKSEAIEKLVDFYIESSGDPELRPEFIEKIRRREKGPFIRVDDFGKRYGLK